MARRFFVFCAFWCALTATLVTQAGTIKGTRLGVEVMVAALDAYHSEFRDYEPASGFPTGPALFSGLASGVELYSSGGASAGLVGYGVPGNQALSGSSGGAPDLSAPIRIDFTSPQNVVGFEVLDLSPFGAETVELTVFYAGGAPSRLFVHQDDDGDGLTPSFLGVISDDLISSVEIASSSGGGAGSIAVDDLIFALAIPEPAVLMLLPPALLLLRRRKSARN